MDRARTAPGRARLSAVAKRLLLEVVLALRAERRRSRPAPDVVDPVDRHHVDLRAVAHQHPRRVPGGGFAPASATSAATGAASPRRSRSRARASASASRSAPNGFNR